MKRIAIPALVLSALASASHADSGGSSGRVRLCATGVVTQIAVGENDTDSGAIIEVQLSTTGSHWWVANRGRNLNDDPGYALLNLLVLSKLSGYKVALGDDKGSRCDDFNAVRLTNQY